MDVEGIDGIDAQGQYLLGIFLARAGGGGQDGDIDVLEFLDVLDNLVLGEFCGLVGSPVPTYYTGNLEVGSGLQGLNGVLSNVAVTYYGGSDFLHCLMLFCWSIS